VIQDSHVIALLHSVLDRQEAIAAE